MDKKSALAVTILAAIIIIFGILWIVFYVGSLSDKYTVFEVDDEHDDARTFTVELNDQGYENEDGAWAFLQLSPSYNFGVRFNNISIPQGAKIKDAFVQLYAIGGPGLNYPNCNIYCDNADNASNFTDTIGVLNISYRNYTTNYVVWNATIEYNRWINTTSITAVVQEIINRENWSSGNSIAVLFVSNGFRYYSATFKNYESGYPAKLYVKWE